MATRALPRRAGLEPIVQEPPTGVGPCIHAGLDQGPDQAVRLLGRCIQAAGQRAGIRNVRSTATTSSGVAPAVGAGS